MITPQQVEKRLFDLSQEIDEAHNDLVQAEQEFHLPRHTMKSQWLNLV
jgi:hypothetical protein